MDTGSFKAWLSVLAGLSDAQIEEAGVALIAARDARPGVEVSCGPAALAAEGELSTAAEKPAKWRRKRLPVLVGFPCSVGGRFLVPA